MPCCRASGESPSRSSRGARFADPAAAPSFIQYYQPSIYKTLNFSVDKQLLVTGLYGSVGPLAVLFSLFIIDKVGRVKLLTFAGAFLAVLYSIIMALAASYPAIPGELSLETGFGDNFADFPALPPHRSTYQRQRSVRVDRLYFPYQYHILGDSGTARLGLPSRDLPCESPVLPRAAPST